MARMWFGSFLVATFLLGSIPTGVLVARRFGVNLRAIGSGNIGTANVSRALGKRWGGLVLLLDAGKGAVPVLAAAAWFAPMQVAVVGITAVLGQILSVFLKGRGGKGVATSLGAGLALAPLAALCSAGLFVLLYRVTRIAAVGSLGGILAFPLFLAVLGLGTPPTYCFAGVVAAVVTFRHKDNLRRLLNRTENRV
jgi:glycerol-3-phosphate acyltransferase PlsY